MAATHFYGAEFFAGEFFFGAPVVVAVPEVFSGGWEPVRRRKTKEEIRLERIALGMFPDPEVERLQEAKKQETELLRKLEKHTITLERIRARREYAEMQKSASSQPSMIDIAIEEQKLQRKMRQLSEDDDLLLF